ACLTHPFRQAPQPGLHRSRHRRTDLRRACNPDKDHARPVLPIHILDRQPTTLADGNKQARSSSEMLRSKTQTIKTRLINKSVFFPLVFLRKSGSAVTKNVRQLRTERSTDPRNSGVGHE